MFDLKPFTFGPSDIADYDSSSYSPKIALLLAEHAIAAYREPAEFRPVAWRAGFTVTAFVDVGSAQAMVAWHPSAIIVALRGSSAAGDWFADLQSIAKVGYSPPLANYYQSGRVRVGFGFRRQAKLLSQELLFRINEARGHCPDAIIAVTGHSLGAALVPLIVAILADHGTAADVAYAFESPRVGNRPFAAWFDETFDLPARDHRVYQAPSSPTYSVVNVHEGVPDLVTRLPRRHWGFRHCGQRVILASGETLFGDEAWQQYRAAHPISRWRPIRRKVSGVKAHLGSQLLEKLRANLARMP